MFRLDDRATLVTGAARGVGAEIARTLSEAGAEHRTYKLGSGITSEYGHYVKSPGEP
jgi:NAD(P)-dependent dehydrogenase (short-subunit alcohol dehydrogenase family)